MIHSQENSRNKCKRDEEFRTCICICMHVCIYVYSEVYMCAYTAYVFMYVHVYIYVCLNVCAYVCVYVCTSVYLHMCACMYLHRCDMCAYSCVFLCMCIFSLSQVVKGKGNQTLDDKIAQQVKVPAVTRWCKVNPQDTHGGSEELTPPSYAQTSTLGL